MGLFKGIVRTDGFYAGNLSKIVDKEKRHFFTTFFFVDVYIIFNMEQLDAPIPINDNIFQTIKNNKDEFTEAMRIGEITQENSPKEVSKFTVTSNAVSADFKDGTDTVKLKLVHRILGGAILYIALEGFQIDWLNPDNSGHRTRKVIDGELVKFYRT